MGTERAAQGARRYDVIVLGAGPAGAAVALALVQNGFSVATISRRQIGATLIGETVPPAIVLPLAKLGLWQSFRDSGHGESPGTVVVWGSDRPYENDYLFNPYGSGWHLDRTRFDTMLHFAARTNGADVFLASAIHGIRQERRDWNVGFEIDGNPRHASAPLIVDATGRAASFARRQGAKRSTLDRLVGLVRFGTISRPEDPRTLIESSEGGWWYAAALPQNRYVAAYFTDFDLVPRGGDERLRLWNCLVPATKLISKGIASIQLLPGLHVVSAASGKLSRIAGRNWLAIGDAAQTYDPISGQGIATALATALAAAKAICAHRSADQRAFDQLESASNRDFRTYRNNLAMHYRREARWLESPFWRRRHVGSTSSRQ